MDDDKKKQIEYYIGRLQSLLSQVVGESREFQELRKLVRSGEGDLQLYVFSMMLDKKTALSFKNMDAELLQKIISEEISSEDFPEELDNSWSDHDRDFLKSLRITI